MAAKLEISEESKPLPMVRVVGEIDHFNCPRAEAVIERLLSDDTKVFVIDLTSVSYLDTAGVAMIFWTAKKLFDRGGDLKLVVPHGDVRRILELAGVGSLPSTVVFDNIDDALEGQT